MPIREDVVRTLSDRRFHELPMAQRQQTLAQMDPQFASFPQTEQNSILTQAYEKYYVKRMPPPDAASIALANSGVQFGERAISSPQRPMQEFADEPAYQKARTAAIPRPPGAMIQPPRVATKPAPVAAPGVAPPVAPGASDQWTTQL